MQLQKVDLLQPAFPLDVFLYSFSSISCCLSGSLFSFALFSFQDYYFVVFNFLDFCALSALLHLCLSLFFYLCSSLCFPLKLTFRFWPSDLMREYITLGISSILVKIWLPNKLWNVSSASVLFFDVSFCFYLGQLQLEDDQGVNLGLESSLTLRRLLVWTYDPKIRLKTLAALVDHCQGLFNLIFLWMLYNYE